VAFTRAAVQLGIAAGTIDGLIGSFRAGHAGGYQRVSTPFFMDLALRRPRTAQRAGIPAIP
jgi:hypothetical protein